MATTTGSLDPEAMLDTAPCGYLAFADDGTVRYANTTICRMLGRSREDVVGKHVERIMTVGTKIFYQTHLFPLLKMSGHADEIFLLLAAASGDEVAVLLSAARQERGGDILNECVFMPVRERRKFEEALLQAKAEAERTAKELRAANRLLEEQAVELEMSQEQLSEQAAALEEQQQDLVMMNQELVKSSAELARLTEVANEANRAKSAFLAAMSHELRTPLNAIGGYAQLLEMGVHGPVTEGQVDALHKVTRSQRHLLRLINEILNLARIESGTLNYRMQMHPLNDVVLAVIPMVEPQLHQREQRLEVSVPAGLEVYADREKLEQIILNLLGNSVKFTPERGEIRLSAAPASGSGGLVEIQISDTGIGIPADRLQAIFEPFIQVEVTPSARSEGTGLGLSISRDLARGMGGDLVAHSELGVGSTFVLTLRSSENSKPVS